MFSNIIFNVKAGVAYITLNRPDAMNAMNHAILTELIEVLQICREDKTVRVLVIGGAGKAFCAGGDVKWMCSARDEANWQSGFDDLVGGLNKAILLIRETEKPVIAVVHGFASGAGFSLALACDMRIISEKAKFNQAYVNLGLTPDGGSTYFLTLMLGPARAMDIILTGRVIEAKEALALGLASELVPAKALNARVEQLAGHFATGPAIAFKQAKTLLNEAHRRILEEQLALERESIVGASLSDDFVEGLKAFTERRKPVFKGN